MLLRHRSGKVAARVLVFGFSGGTMLLGVASSAAGAAQGGMGSIFRGLVAYGLATLPFLALAGIVALCKSELWVVPEAHVFRLLTFRPWRLQPRIEDAPLADYAGVRTDPAPDKYGGGTVVSLVAADGEVVAMRQFRGSAEARTFAQKLAEVSGLWLRHAGAEEAAVTP